MKKKGSILSPIVIVAVLVALLLITGTHGSSSGGSVLASTLGSIAKILLWGAVLILILLIAVSSIGNLVFRLPDSLQLLDELGGALVGFVKGFLYCVLLCWLLSFLGLAIGRETLESTLLARFFLTFRFLTNGLL